MPLDCAERMLRQAHSGFDFGCVATDPDLDILFRPVMPVQDMAVRMDCRIWRYALRRLAHPAIHPHRNNYRLRPEADFLGLATGCALIDTLVTGGLIFIDRIGIPIFDSMQFIAHRADYHIRIFPDEAAQLGFFLDVNLLYTQYFGQSPPNQLRQLI